MIQIITVDKALQLLKSAYAQLNKETFSREYVLQEFRPQIKIIKKLGLFDETDLDKYEAFKYKLSLAIAHLVQMQSISKEREKENGAERSRLPFVQRYFFLLLLLAGITIFATIFTFAPYSGFLPPAHTTIGILVYIILMSMLRASPAKSPFFAVWALIMDILLAFTLVFG